MDKQEEIRKGIERLYSSSKRLARTPVQFSGDLVPYLHSQGVVIKGKYCGMSHLDIWREVFTVEPIIGEENNGNNEVS